MDTPFSRNNVRGAQHILAALDSAGNVVKAAARYGMVARVGEIAAFVAEEKGFSKMRYGMRALTTGTIHTAYPRGSRMLAII